MNRRMFLRGVGGTTLTIPFLGSLAHGGQSLPSKRFVAMATQHGGIWGEHMWPDDAMLTETDDVGHTIRRGDLVGATSGADTVLSQVLTANSNRLTPAMMGELNLLRGLDVPFYMGHHTGGHLGNYGRHDGEGDDPSPIPYRPTIDQLMAWSNGFYSNLDGVVRRSVHIGQDMSWGWSNPLTASGNIDLTPSTWSSRGLFDALFASSGGPNRRLVVDRVMESYSRLRSGTSGPARRISQGDAHRLDAHMQRLFEVERRLAVSNACGVQTRPTEDTQGHAGNPWGSDALVDVFAYHQLWNEVLALALTCGATRVATYNCVHPFEPFTGDWHQDVAHQALGDFNAEQRIVRGHQRFFEEVFLDLCERLDVPDVDGNSVLHNSMLFWTQESGPSTHDPITMPVITAGSAGGALRTGQYIDYRDRMNLSIPSPWQTAQVTLDQRPGLFYSQFLGSTLDAMDVARSDWEIPGNPGYGEYRNTNAAAWPTRIETLANQPLPWLMT